MADLERLVEEAGNTSLQDARRTIDRLQKALAKEKDRTEAIVEAVDEAVRDAIAALEIPPVPLPPKQTKTRNSETAVVLLSDWQLGKATPTYSSDVCESRIEFLTERIDRLVDIQRQDHPVKKIALLLLGDMIEGELIFPNQAWQIDASLFRQVAVDGPRILGGLVRWASSRFEQVDIYAVPGNHGHIGGRAWKEMHPESNGDRILYQICSQLTGTLTNVQWNVSLDWWQIADLGDKCRFLLLHGDQVRGYNGIPWYGWARKVLAWGSLSRVWPDMEFDHVAAGHFHTPVSIYLNGRRIWINASTESHNPYALEQLAAAGEPAQWLLFVKPGQGVTAEYLVQLS